MEAVILVGLQASGKSTFYRERFYDTHLRLNLDMLRTRHREAILFEACLKAKQPFVVDNTNPTVEDRLRYIEPAKMARFSVVGYYFQSSIEDCLRRNREREISRVISSRGLLATYNKMEIPAFSEGFDALYYVRIDREGAFLVSEWQERVE